MRISRLRSRGFFLYFPRRAFLPFGTGEAVRRSSSTASSMSMEKTVRISSPYLSPTLGFALSWILQAR